MITQLGARLFNNITGSINQITAKKLNNNRIGLDVNVENLRRTSFDELKTVRRFAQIELKSAIENVSALRNVTTTTNGSVTVANTGEYKVSTDANTSASAELKSAERGRYIPGYEAEMGVGIRLPSQTFTGNARAEWGYFDDDDGFGFGHDQNGTYVFVDRLGVRESKVYQSEWSNDTLDGSNDDNNPSGLSLDLTNGHIFQVEFIWYGYGPIQWFVNMKGSTIFRGSENVLVHTQITNQTTSIAQPNLPITVKLENVNDATAREIFVGGRQFSIYGEPTQKFRIVGDRRRSISLDAAVWEPIISFRRKTGRGNNQSVQVSDVDIVPAEDVYFSFVSGGSLTGASWGDLSDFSATETTVESDISATAITGGNFFGGIHIATSGQGSKSLATTLEQIDFDFVNSEPVTLVCRTVDGTTGTITDATMNVREQW